MHRRETSHRCSEQRRGLDTRLAGMGNIGESLINVVLLEMSKLLIGNNRKVCGGCSAINQVTSSKTSTGEKATLDRSCDGMGTW